MYGYKVKIVMTTIGSHLGYDFPELTTSYQLIWRLLTNE